MRPSEKFDWEGLLHQKPKHFEAIRNDWTGKDKVVRLGRLLKWKIPDFGSAGIFGFALGRCRFSKGSYRRCGPSFPRANQKCPRSKIRNLPFQKRPKRTTLSFPVQSFRMASNALGFDGAVLPNQTSRLGRIRQTQSFGPKRQEKSLR